MAAFTINIISFNLTIVNGKVLKFSISLPVFNICTLKGVLPVGKTPNATFVLSEITLFLAVLAVISAGAAVFALILVLLIAVLVIVVVIVVSVLIFVFVVHNFTPLSVLGTFVPCLV